MKKYLLRIIIEILMIGLVIAIDMLTKTFIYQKAFEQGKIPLIDGVLSFTAVKNTGASFGIFADKTIILTIISAISAAGLLTFLILNKKNNNPLYIISLILIIGGAVGNLIDRITLGYVRDFVYFELIDFAVFNLADSALTIGTVLLIIYVVFFYKTKEEKK